MKHVTVQIPATSANLGPGFDVLGVALRWFNELEFRTAAFASSPESFLSGLSIDVRGEGKQSLKRDGSNLVIRAALQIFDAAKKWPVKLRVILNNRIPLSRGLGSSAAATLGGMVAANRLLGRPFSNQEILEKAVRMEGHPDNVVPAFAGGLCASVLIGTTVHYFKVPARPSLRAVVCSPEMPLPTSEARRVLPSQVPFSAAVFTASRVAFLLGAISTRSYEWLGFAMEDVLHQPARARLVPGLNEAIQAAKGAGAYGCALSGAGSSVIAFTKPGRLEAKVGAALKAAFSSHGLGSEWAAVAIENRGIRVKNSQ